MSDIITGIILGFVQGITEFLPISSSGHLILVRDLFNLSVPNELLFDVLLHLATALAIVVYFRREVWAMIVQPATHKVLWLAIILGSIPAVLLGLFLDGAFRGTSVVAVTLVIGSILFLIAEKLATQDKTLTVKKGFAIGLFQALALIPGMSRSGATISGGLLLGMKREEAARFSFFLGLPVILGAGVFQILKDFGDLSAGGVQTSLVVGSIVSFFTGIIAIHYLLRFLKTNTLKVFAWYRILLAIAIFFLL